MKMLFFGAVVTFFALNVHAQQSCQAVLGDRSFDVRAVMMSAEKAYTNRRYQRAMNYLDEILSADPHDYRAMGLKARILSGLNKNEEAVLLQLKAIELEGEFREQSYISLSKMYKAIGDFNHEAAALHAVLEHVPHHRAVESFLIRNYFSRGEVGKAGELILKRYSMENDNPQTLSLMAEFFYRRNEYSNALRAVNGLLRLSQSIESKGKRTNMHLTGLSMRARIYAARTKTAQLAMDDIKVVFRELREFSPWLRKIKAEAYFRKSRAQVPLVRARSLEISHDILNGTIKHLENPDLSVIAASFRVQKRMREFNEDEFSNFWRDFFSPKDFRLALNIAKGNDWDFQLTRADNHSHAAYGDFWAYLESNPINVYRNKKTVNKK